MFRVGILGTGSCLGSQRIGNDHFDRYGSDIKSRLDKVGIKERRWADESQSLPVMMAVSAQLALEDAGLTIKEVDGIYVGTNSTDRFLVPSQASRLQYLLDAPKVQAVDFGVGCSGVVQAIRSGITELFYKNNFESNSVGSDESRPRNLLAIGGDVLEKVTRRSSPVTRGILGDGAAACVLSVLPEAKSHLGIYHAFTRAHGDLAHLISYTSGYDGEVSDFQMNGRGVHKFVRAVTSEMVSELFTKSGLPISELSNAKVAPHQVNFNSLSRVPEWLQEDLGYSPAPENVYTRGAIEHGNTSGASTLVALDDMNRSGALAYGDLVMMLVWGAGMTNGGVLMRWNKSEIPKRNFDDGIEQTRLADLFGKRYNLFKEEVGKIRERRFSD